MATMKKTSSILKVLSQMYPNAKAELNFQNDYELIIAVVLSAQCTDKKVNQVTPLLFKNYPNFKALSKAKIGDIETIIREVNYYKTKAKNIITLASQITNNFKGKLPSDLDTLQTLAGVGRKTASVVLCEKGTTPALPVDTHVLRVSNRLGLSDGKTPLAVEADLRDLFPPSTWHDLHHELILHGRRICKARQPLCEVCDLKKYCNFSG